MVPRQSWLSSPALYRWGLMTPVPLSRMCCCLEAAAEIKCTISQAVVDSFTWSWLCCFMYALVVSCYGGLLHSSACMLVLIALIRKVKHFNEIQAEAKPTAWAQASYFATFASWDFCPLKTGPSPLTRNLRRSETCSVRVYSKIESLSPHGVQCLFQKNTFTLLALPARISCCYYCSEWYICIHDTLIYQHRPICFCIVECLFKHAAIELYGMTGAQCFFSAAHYRETPTV